ncbi:uncharacterized protein MYCFIDRAFT_174812 [Pseudocercospora fijiensis CIRAD86]|uniref:Uncharacterized protein n=1 Tax=Pseudocercospora fijiensis (strain CIRAD86) TaxID=383855 RepID=M2Z0J0_PSEFD|nr:uncharacterized protein MYCFIDRAFT_174812 [Pseudocercospora fijiensis CIRAD86]EME83355.1 hypothetical protein MYCFIDRAFT_174812 [Pseudocercospora fijiensis CIRAD86]
MGNARGSAEAPTGGDGVDKECIWRVSASRREQGMGHLSPAEEEMILDQACSESETSKRGYGASGTCSCHHFARKEPLGYSRSKLLDMVLHYFPCISYGTCMRLSIPAPLQLFSTAIIVPASPEQPDIAWPLLIFPRRHCRRARDWLLSFGIHVSQGPLWL